MSLREAPAVLLSQTETCLTVSICIECGLTPKTALSGKVSFVDRLVVESYIYHLPHRCAEVAGTTLRFSASSPLSKFVFWRFVDGIVNHLLDTSISEIGRPLAST